MQAAEIKRATDSGYTLTEHKGLKILTKDEAGKFYLKIYKDASAHLFANYFYRSEASRAEGLERIKANYDSREEFKAKRKKEGKHITTAAKCAAQIKEELKGAFKGVKFSVTSDNFSMGDSVHISWEDGPTAEMVEGVTDKYQYGHFDGMTDMYESSNTRDDIYQSKYVSAHRKQSEETRKVLDEAQKANFPESHQNNETYKIFYKTPLPVGAVVTGISRNGQSGSIEDCYVIDFEAPETAPEVERPEVVAGKVQIIEHPHPSRKGKILVIGDTYPIKSKLKELGGRWNRFEKGWEFEGSELEKLTKELGKKEEESNPPGIPEGYTKSEHPEMPIGYLTAAQVKAYNSPESVAERKRKALEAEGVKTYESLEEIEEAANSGEMISLCNLSELVNKPKSAQMRLL